jgi:hypothetical protein
VVVVVVVVVVVAAAVVVVVAVVDGVATDDKVLCVVATALEVVDVDNEDDGALVADEVVGTTWHVT